MALYPSQHFPFGAAFVCQAGNFWTLLRTFISLTLPRIRRSQTIYLRYSDIIQSRPGSQSPVNTEIRGSPSTEGVCEIQRKPTGDLSPL